MQPKMNEKNYYGIFLILNKLIKEKQLINSYIAKLNFF